MERSFRQRVAFVLFQLVSIWRMSNRRWLQGEGSVAVGGIRADDSSELMGSIVGQGHYTDLAAQCDYRRVLFRKPFPACRG